MNQFSQDLFVLQALSTGKRRPSGFATRYFSPVLLVTVAFAAEYFPSCHPFLLFFCPLVLFLATMPPPL
jgi:hypothetical protein